MNYFSLTIFLLSLGKSFSQSSFATPVIDTSPDGIVYLLLVILFTVAYGVPIVLWIWRFFNNRVKEPVKKKLAEMKAKILELKAVENIRRMSKRYSQSVHSIHSFREDSRVHISATTAT